MSVQKDGFYFFEHSRSNEPFFTVTLRTISSCRVIARDGTWTTVSALLAEAETMSGADAFP
nr:hypothetical protein [Evansella caseinilytica]